MLASSLSTIHLKATLSSLTHQRCSMSERRQRCSRYPWMHVSRGPGGDMHNVKVLTPVVKEGASNRSIYKDWHSNLIWTFASTYHELKNKKKLPRTCSQAWNPPLGGGPGSSPFSGSTDVSGGGRVMLASASRASPSVEPLLWTGVRGGKDGSRFFSGSALEDSALSPGDNPMPRLSLSIDRWSRTSSQSYHADDNSTEQ